MVYAYLLMGAFLVGTVVWGAKYFSETGGPARENEASEVVKPVDDLKPSPTGDNMEPSGDDMKPSGDDMKPSGDDMKPSGDDMKPSGDDMKPSGNDMKPSSDNMKPSQPDNDTEPSSPLETSTKPPMTKPTTTKKISKHLAGYFGNGWWSSHLYSGWTPNSYPGVSWGTGFKPPKRPGGGSSDLFNFDVNLPSSADMAASINFLSNLSQIYFSSDLLGGSKGGNLYDGTTTTTTEPAYEESVSEYDAAVVTVHKDHLKPPPGGWGVDYNPYFYFNG